MITERMTSRKSGVDEGIGEERLAGAQHATPASIRRPGLVGGPLPATMVVGSDGMGKVGAVGEPNAGDKVKVEEIGVVAVIDAEEPYGVVVWDEEGRAFSCGEGVGEPTCQAFSLQQTTELGRGRRAHAKHDHTPTSDTSHCQIQPHMFLRPHQNKKKDYKRLATLGKGSYATVWVCLFKIT